jgi:hypothetical protein
MPRRPKAGATREAGRRNGYDGPNCSSFAPGLDEVMAAQRDLVEPLARFEPRLVKMVPGEEPAED